MASTSPALPAMDLDAAPAAGLRERLPLILALLSTYVIWGSTYYAMHVALDGFPPLLMGGVRYVVAGALLFAFLRARGAAAPTRVQWRSAAVVGALLLLAGNGGVAIGQTRVSSSLAAVVVASMPLWAALFATLFGRRPAGAEWAALVLGFAGVALLNAGGELSAQGPAVLALFAAPICWAFGSVIAPRLPFAAGAMATASQMLLGGVEMLAFGFARGERFTAVPSARAILAVLYLVVFGSIVAFSAYGYLLRNARPAVATSYAYVNPIIAIALGALLGGERVGARAMIAAAVIIAGVVTLTLARTRAARGVETPAKSG